MGNLGSYLAYYWPSASQTALSLFEPTLPHIKVVILGAPKSGKSTLMRKLLSMEDSGDEKKLSTYSVAGQLPAFTMGDFSYRDEKRVSLHDIGSSDSMYALWQYYCRDAHGMIFLLDAREDVNELETQLERLEQLLAYECIADTIVAVGITHLDEVAMDEEIERRLLSWWMDILRPMFHASSGGPQRKWMCVFMDPSTSRGVFETMDWIATRT